MALDTQRKASNTDLGVQGRLRGGGDSLVETKHTQELSRLSLFPLYRRACCSHSTLVKRLVVESNLNLRHVSKLFTSNSSSFTLGPIYIVLGLPWWLRQYRICLLCRRPEFIPWVGKNTGRREWLPTPLFLLGESHGQRSLVGDSPWDCRVGHN